MPGPLLHLGATVTCSHAGQAVPNAPSPRVFVSGQSVSPMSSPYSIAGCTLPPPPNGNGPCVSGQFTSAATRVFVNAVPVVLMDSMSTCVPTGTPMIPGAAQTRVTGT